ncbi:MAG: hypothetical protein ABR598_04160 [Candidatus Dormibacteria bacterium]
MRLRLWAYWEPSAADEMNAGYHLEVERPYARVPVVGESVYLPATRFGQSHPEIARVQWGEGEVPDLILGTYWNESEGASLDELTEAGFHQRDGSECRYCENRP